MTRPTRKKSTKLRTSDYDVADHLRTPEERAEYLDAYREEAPDDLAGIARALGDVARAKGMSQVAKEAGGPSRRRAQAGSAKVRPVRVPAFKGSGGLLEGVNPLCNKALLDALGDDA